MPDPERYSSLRRILENLRDGSIDIETAERELNLFSIDHISDIATIDPCRQNRKGVPEVVYADMKRPGDAASIALRLVEKNGYAFMTRAAREHLTAVEMSVAEFMGMKERGLSTTCGEILVTYNEKARTILLKQEGFGFPDTGGRIGILTAGTSDIPVAEEAMETCRIMGCETITFYDVGIAGMHRLFDPLKRMIEFGVDVIIVVAGMEGALPSVVSSLVSVPVIGVPSSVGYGYGGKGEAALMSMLQTCSPGLVVVNIDNGFGAGVGAALIARTRKGSNRECEEKEECNECEDIEECKDHEECEDNVEHG